MKVSFLCNAFTNYMNKTLELRTKKKSHQTKMKEMWKKKSGYRLNIIPEENKLEKFPLMKYLKRLSLFKNKNFHLTEYLLLHSNFELHSTFEEHIVLHTFLTHALTFISFDKSNSMIFEKSYLCKIFDRCGNILQSDTNHAGEQTSVHDVQIKWALNKHKRIIFVLI